MFLLKKIRSLTAAILDFGKMVANSTKTRMSHFGLLKQLLGQD
jgi:hypothetical protein